MRKIAIALIEYRRQAEGILYWLKEGEVISIYNDFKDLRIVILIVLVEYNSVCGLGFLGHYKMILLCNNIISICLLAQRFQNQEMSKEKKGSGVGGIVVL